MDGTFQPVPAVKSIRLKIAWIENLFRKPPRRPIREAGGSDVGGIACARTA
jgi:hypothetical protein